VRGRVRGTAQRGGPAAGGRDGGGRAQAAKTYLERKFEEFEGADLDALIRHGLQARARQAPSRPAPDGPGLAWCQRLARTPARIAHLARMCVCVGDRVAKRLLRAPCRAQGVQVGLTQACRTLRRRQAAGGEFCRRAAPCVSLDPCAWGAARASSGACASRASAPDGVARALRRGARRPGRAVRRADAAGGAQALSASVTDGELTKDNVSIALVGAGTPLTLLEDAELEPHLAALRDEPRAGAVPAPSRGCQVRVAVTRQPAAAFTLSVVVQDARAAGTEAAFQGATQRGCCAAPGPACKLAVWLHPDQRDLNRAFLKCLGACSAGCLARCTAIGCVGCDSSADACTLYLGNVMDDAPRGRLLRTATAPSTMRRDSKGCVIATGAGKPRSGRGQPPRAVS
jgi:hypothetical protein